MIISSSEGWKTPLTKLLNLSNLCTTRLPLNSGIFQNTLGMYIRTHLSSSSSCYCRELRESYSGRLLIARNVGGKCEFDSVVN